MGEVEAEKLFKPITSELKELTAPKAPLRRLVKKKRPVPDYGIAIDDEVPDYGLEDLFGDQVLPQDDKQLVPKPPSYEDVLNELASEKKDPKYTYEVDDLPTIYEEEVPDYEIFEEDKINEVLDQLEIPNYEYIESLLKQENMNNKERKTNINNALKLAKIKKRQLPGFLSDISKKLNKGSITEAEAQYKRKVIEDAKKVLIDYIDYTNQKLNDIKGSGLKKKTKRGGQVMFFNNPTEMIKKLELIIGSMIAGNNSIELRNTGVALLDILLRNSILNKPQYNKIYKNYFSLN